MTETLLETSGAARRSPSPSDVSPGRDEKPYAVHLRDAQLRIAELEGRLAFLENRPSEVEVVKVVQPEYRTVVQENSEHVDRLTALLHAQRDQIVALNADLAAARGRPPEVVEVAKTQYVVEPLVETKVVEVEGPEVAPAHEAARGQHEPG